MSKQNTYKDKILPWTFIIVQAFLILLIVFYDAKNTKVTQLESISANFLLIMGFTGLLISAVNLGKSLTALPDPKKNGQLNTGGLYKFSRHPMYTSVLMICFGIAGLDGSFVKSIFCILLVVLFVFKAKYEENKLSEKYKAYSAYAKKTPMFLPIKIGGKK
jgi:protein-S-isoprenylcysteine O-methyltransferase Ste14